MVVIVARSSVYCRKYAGCAPVGRTTHQWAPKEVERRLDRRGEPEKAEAPKKGITGAKKKLRAKAGTEMRVKIG